MHEEEIEETAGVSLKNLRPYRVRLSLVYEYLVLAESQTAACSLGDAKAALAEESTPEQKDWAVEAAETDLSSLPRWWDEDSCLYGPIDNFSVQAAREMLAERAIESLVVGSRAYDRHADLFGQIEEIRAASLRGRI